MGQLRPVSETILKRAKEDPEFRAALLAEAIELLAENDVQTAKSIIRNYVLASIGFEVLAKQIDKKPESSDPSNGVHRNSRPISLRSECLFESCPNLTQISRTTFNSTYVRRFARRALP